MPNVLNEFAGDGVTRTFTFSMTGGYLSRDYVFFYTRPNDDLLAYTPYDDDNVTWVGDYTVQLSAPIPVGTTFVIIRSTPLAPLVDFQNTSRITEKNLDTATQQAVHIAAENADIVGRIQVVVADAEQTSGSALLIAQEAADAAITAASNAQSASTAASAAQASAAQAEAAALDAMQSAQASESIAVSAEATSNAAYAMAETALNTANSAIDTATAADAAATAAVDTANSTIATANAAAADASAAVSSANAAVDTANTAMDVANAAKAAIDSAVAGSVVSFNGRDGAVVPEAGDYSLEMVTGLQDALDAKQDTLVSGANIKTINGESLLGGGDLVVAVGGPTLQGDTSPYISQTKTYQITNYSSFSSYTVSASAGTASISGDIVTYTAPATAGSVSLTLTVDGQPTVFVINVQAAGVVKPTNISPAVGATDITDSPTLQSSAFAAYGLTDTHLASRWTVYQGGVAVHSSGWLTDALTSYTVPAGVMTESTTYTWTVEHRGTTLGDSAPSTATSFTTAASFNSYIPTPAPTPENFGDPLEGGFYAGMIWNQIAQSSSSKTLATGTQTFTVPDMTNAPIVYGGQMVEVRSRANPANKFIGTVTGALGTSLTINVTSIGGSGTFSDWSIMARFRIIVAPKASGEHPGIALKNTATALPTACQTLTEGFAATQAMYDADTSTVYPAAHWARNLSIGGRTDWYIPARDELELSWRNLKPGTAKNTTTTNRPTGASFNYSNNGSYGDTSNIPGINNNSVPPGATYTSTIPTQTSATAFQAGGVEAYDSSWVLYWSSSDYNTTDAWRQFWNNGGQYVSAKTGTDRVRAVRRSII